MSLKKKSNFKIETNVYPNLWRRNPFWRVNIAEKHPLVYFDRVYVQAPNQGSSNIVGHSADDSQISLGSTTSMLNR